MSKTNINEIEINGVCYVPKTLHNSLPTGPRAIVVLDRGWVVAGDVTEKDGRLLIDNAVHVRSWSDIGYDGLVSSGGRGPKVVVKKMTSRFDAPKDSELFRTPVEKDWGL